MVFRWSPNYPDLYDRALAAGFTVGQEGRIGGDPEVAANLLAELG